MAMLGIYSATSFQVEQARRATGIRMALGASPWQLFTGVLRQGLRLVLPGIALGALAALALSKFIASLLYGVTILDAFTYSAVLASLLMAALAAILSPALRAARVEPVQALQGGMKKRFNRDGGDEGDKAKWGSDVA